MRAQITLVYVITAMSIEREKVAIAARAFVRLLNIVAFVGTLDEIAACVRVRLPEQLLKRVFFS